METSEPAVTVTAIDRVAAPPARSRANAQGKTSTRLPGRKSHLATRATTGPLVQVTGRVAFEDGTPLSERLSSATVELWRTANSDGVASRSEQRLDSSEIDENGRYLLAGADDNDLRVEVVGVSRAIADLRNPTDMTTQPRVRKITQDFLIPAPHEISGYVMDARNNPVTSAIVSLRSEDVITDGWYYGNQQTTVTANGRFTLEGVAAGQATIGAAAPGFGAITRDIVAPTSGPITLRLTTGTASVIGHVLQFPTDTPVAAARVTLRPTGKADTLGLDAAASAETNTAADGSFQITHVSAGEYKFSVTASDGTELFAAPGKDSAAAMSPKIQDNYTTAIALRVFRGYTITGQVYDKDTSDPLSNSVVTAYRASTPMQRDTTGEDGQFKLERIGSDWQADLAVTLDGYMLSPEHNFSYRSGAPAVRVAYPDDSDSVNVDVPMVAVVTVAGRVENKDGLPVAGGEVQWNGSAFRNSTRSNKQVTDADGHFQFKVLPFQDGLIEVNASGYAFKRSDTIKVATQNLEDLVIVLEDGAKVEGRVVDPDGEGVSEASISLNDLYSLAGSSIWTNRELGKSEADGYFFIDSLDVQKAQRLKATAAGFSPGIAVVHLQPGETKTGVEIKLAEELTIEGRVVDAKDRPVQASLMGMGFKATQTNQRGEFKLAGLSPGQISIYVQASGPHKSKNVTAEVPTRDLLIKLDGDEGNIAHCKVIDRVTRRPIESFDVVNAGQINREGEGPGGFSFPINPGHTVIPKVSAEGYVTRSFRVEAPLEGGDFEKTLEMGIGSGVNGRVIDLEGKPVANVPIAAYEESIGSFSNTPSGNSVSGEDGKFLISKLPAGKIRVAAIPAAPLAPASRTVELNDGEFPDIGDLVIEQLGSISGKVVWTPSGEPVNNAYVNINSHNEGSRFYKLIVTGPDGVFHVGELTPGQYSIRVNSVTEEVNVQSGEDRDVIIELGTVTLKGKITRGNTPASASINMTNKQTGKAASGNTVNETGNYRISGLTPGDYDVAITPFQTRGEKPTTGSLTGVNESITLPDQPEVVKDFVLP